MSARHWPTFNESAACPKCGSADVGTSYRFRGHSNYSDRVNVFHADEGDWLQRYCKRCQFSWPEEPLDRTA